MLRRVVILLLLLALLVPAGLYQAGVLRLPPRWDPRAPLDIRDTPTLVTHWKLARLEWQPSACLAALETSRLEMPRVPDRASETGCPIANAVRLEAGEATLSPARPVVTCPLAVAWAMFERHALQPAARAHFGQGVRSARHLGTYNCRNVYHRQGGRRSQHATANAIDIAGFTLADGRGITLLRDWGEEEGAEAAHGTPAAFLRDVRDGACRYFRAVLGPDYNAPHRDHFHLDRGRWSRCS